MTQETNPSTAHIAPVATEPKRRGKKPSGIVKNNVCVRLTDDMKTYLLDVGKGSTSRGVDVLIDWHQKEQAALEAVAP